MVIKNNKTGLFESVNVGDILYTYYEGPRDNRIRQKTWTFRCQGILEKKDHVYILAPGDVLYELGTDCFKTDIEARTAGYNHNGTRRKSIKSRNQFRFLILKEDEKVRI